MSDTVLFLSVVAGLFVVLTLFTSIESRRGQRLILSRFRGWLDRVLARAISGLQWSIEYTVRNLIQLSWHYGIHALLKTCLWCLATLYGWIERVLRVNRDRARQLRKEKAREGSYFRAMADHKTATNLSDAERTERRRRELESGI